MAADRATEADNDAETVEKPAADRPPPDRPGTHGFPSRAESRACAAAANESSREQEDASPLGETTGAPADDDAGKTGSGAADDEPSSSESADTEQRLPDETDRAARTFEGDAGHRPSDVPGRVDDGVEPSVSSRKVGESPEIIHRVKASVAGGALGDRSDTVADPAKQAKDPPGVALFQPADRSERRVEPLDDRAYAEHTRHVESTVREAIERGESTDVKYTLNPERTIWDFDRAEVHQQILDELYSAAADVPNDGQAIIAGGLGGAGKSTTLEDHAGIDRSKYLTINPDDIKEALGRRGMIPDLEGLAPMERSALVHEESSQIAGALADRAYADRKNVIWDITMSSKSSVAKRIQQLRDAGYDIEGVFVHIPVEKSVERAEARHRQGLEDYRNGEGLGGRYVPLDIIRANADPTWGSVNRGVFEELKPQFDRWRIYDNSVDGRDPVLLESSDSSEGSEDE